MAELVGYADRADILNQMSALPWDQNPRNIDFQRTNQWTIDH